MIQKVECFTLECDNCKEIFQDEHSGFSIFVDESSAWEYADNDGWYEDKGKHYCPSCHDFDDDDNLIIKNQ